jgi:hypothetical protein
LLRIVAKSASGFGWEEGNVPAEAHPSYALFSKCRAVAATVLLRARNHSCPDPAIVILFNI